MIFYDRLVVPVVRFLERVIARPPFGQSVLAIARVADGAGGQAGTPGPA
jgi:hypothetical protein